MTTRYLPLFIFAVGVGMAIAGVASMSRGVLAIAAVIFVVGVCAVLLQRVRRTSTDEQIAQQTVSVSRELVTAAQLCMSGTGQFARAVSTDRLPTQPMAAQPMPVETITMQANAAARTILSHDQRMSAHAAQIAHNTLPGH